MLDSTVAELTDRLIQSQLAERRKQLQQELIAISRRLSANGLLRSGAHIQQVTEACRHEIETRGWIVWNAHRRVLSELAVAPYPELSRDLKSRMAHYLPLGDDYAQPPRDLAELLGVQSHPDIRVHEAHEHVLAKMGTEIDLFVETLNRRIQQLAEPTPGNSVVNIYAPIGALQTGPGATANVVQQIGNNDKKALQEALLTVREALSALSEQVNFPKAEIIEMVDEASSEVVKPTPNRFKLTSMLTAIGDTIRVVGSMNSAYQSLKVALLPLGITLP
mgnify:CR=1 FL=1|jgi:hypothetical protein